MRPITPSPGNVGIRQEARVLYTLLDAAASAGLIVGTSLEPCWHELNARVHAGASYESEAHLFHELLSALELSGGLRGTWIEERWRTIQSRAALTH